MNKTLAASTLVLVSMLAVSGCAAIAGIFEAGVWVGVIVMVAVIGGIIWAIAR